MLVLKKEGVILKPGSGFPVSDPIGSVMWKVSPDIAIEWEVSDPDVTYYGHFKAPVPEPTVTTSCDEEKAGCTLTCEGNTRRLQVEVRRHRVDNCIKGSPREKGVVMTITLVFVSL
ncbi:Hypothetical protein SMAX5B_013600 [Scophthalmus maximus]|uniref:Uncharacterized protein n=1 Tax=Scophthalmus maximus TaxID=52904 RepID=A0A2U9BA55_SCOMX|nr:Hypothetical protein SMAX5B_013600 [Scophthalmus maximus]